MKAPTMNGWRNSSSLYRPEVARPEIARRFALRGGAVLSAWCLGWLSTLSLAGVEVEQTWRGLIRNEHVSVIEQGPSQAEALLQGIGADDYGYDEREVVVALLQAGTMARPAQRLLGDWRCRSIQVNRYGIFSYPPFRCQIRLVEGEWDFRKLSGSQRRSGSLYLDAPGKWVFLGGSHVNDDPPRHYSGFDQSPQSRESDSVGVLQTLVDGRLRLLMDVDADSFEVYVLER